ncbi:MAG: histidinol-phosphate transaminase [Dehalococcoidia bacterium]
MPPFDLQSALRPALRGMRGYNPIAPPEEVAARYGIPVERIVKLDANENPYGPAPRALEAVRDLTSANRYPDPDQRAMRAALATRHGVDPDCIVAGAGSDEIIDLLFRAFVSPGDRVVVASPTFGMYAFDGELQGAEVVDVPLRNGWAFDTEALVEAASTARLVCIPSPNNPTGNLLPRDLAEAIAASGALLVVDEAYIEFSHAESLAAAAAAGGSIVVLRTFSKWGGLAGLRIGYGIMPRDVARTLMLVKQPYGVNVAAEAAALASLEDIALLDERACTLAGERDRMADALRALGWLDPAPSEANFVLCRLLRSDGVTVREALRRRGIFVRTFDHPRLTDHLRISAGRPEDTERLLAALNEIEGEL